MMHSHNQVVPGHDDRADQEAAHRFPGPRTAHGHRPDLYRRRRARRRAQGQDQQDRAARLCDELQRAGHVRPVPEALSGRPGQISLSRPRPEGHRVPPRRLPSAAAVPRHDRRRAQGAGPIQLRAARRVTPATWTSAIWSRAPRSMCPCMCRARCCGPAIPMPAQGNGEVNLTAIETAYREFNITVDVIKGQPLDMPRIETPRSWITDGLRPGSEQGWDQAKAQTVKFLSEQRNDLGRGGGKADGHRLRLPRLAGRQRQEGHPLPQPEERARQGGHGAPDQETPALLRHPRQGRRSQQGDGRRVAGR